MTTHREAEAERIRVAARERAAQMLAERGPIPDHLAAPIRESRIEDARQQAAQRGGSPAA